MATRSYTFAHLIRRMAIALTAALGLNMAVSLLAVRAVWSEQKQGASDKISGITLQINSILHGIEQTVSGELSYDTDIMRLCVSGGANYLSPIEKYRIEKRLKNMLEAWRGQFGFTMNYVIYVPETDTAVTGCSVSEDYLLWYGIEDEVKGYMRKNAPDRYLVGDLWHMARFGGENYAVYYSRMDECYMLCYISEKSFLGSIASGSQDAEEAAYFLPGEAGISGGGGIWPGQADADFSEYEDGEIDTGLAGSRITARMSLANADFSVGIISSDNDHIISLVIFQLVLELLLVITSAGCLGLVFYIRRTVILPIQAFSSDLERLKEDDTYTVATHYQINELGKASALLEGMVRRIKKMKIDIYERTLKEQQIELDFLALQIEPHFYLNCLNIIYNLAELERYKEIQSLSKNVSDYMRYIFRHRNDLVLFKDELGHIKKYLEIQTIRYRGGFLADIDVEGQVLLVEMPPLIVQTFVENAVKHTVDWENQICISLRARRGCFEGKDIVDIFVEDTGEGFESQALEILNHGGSLADGDKRIGIANAVLRLKLIYGSAARVEFSNLSPHGARVHIRIPCGVPKRRESGNESADG